ncbi:hypothetical protein PV326_002295 [Microctonus aethiopoides]|nr:hypothetical protein PV326_002295 [Microctonus aethiopoides]
MRHVQGDVEQHASMLNPSIQYNFNVVKPEPMDTMLYGGSMSVGGTSPLASLKDSCPSSPRQTLRPIHSPGHRTPSPISYMTSHVGAMQLQPPQDLIYQNQLSPGNASVNFPSDAVANPIILSRVTPDPSEPIKLQQLVDTDGANSILDLDSNQFSFDMNQLDNFNPLNSAELAVFGTALSDNFSNGLSISEPNKAQPVKELSDDTAMNLGESSSMTDSFTRLTNTTIQELCTLNSIYNPTKDRKDNSE